MPIASIIIIPQLTKVIVLHGNGFKDEIPFEQLYNSIFIMAQERGIPVNDLNQTGNPYIQNGTSYFATEVVRL